MIRRETGAPSPTAETVPLRRASAPVSPVNAAPRSGPPPRPLAPGSRAGPPQRSESPPPPVPPRPGRKRGKRRWGRMVALSLLIGALLTGAGIVGGAFWFDTRLHRAAVLV